MKLLQVSDFNSMTSLQVVNEGFSHVTIIDVSALVSGNNFDVEVKPIELDKIVANDHNINDRYHRAIQFRMSHKTLM